MIVRNVAVDAVDEHRPRDRHRVVVGVLGRIDLRVGIGRRRSATGVASARNGAIARSPASASPAYATIAMITSSPWRSGGTNGIGGQGMTLAIVDSSSGAASAAAMNPATVSGGGRQEQHPADDPGSSWSR